MSRNRAIATSDRTTDVLIIRYGPAAPGLCPPTGAIYTSLPQCRGDGLFTSLITAGIRSPIAPRLVLLVLLSSLLAHALCSSQDQIACADLAVTDSPLFARNRAIRYHRAMRPGRGGWAAIDMTANLENHKCCCLHFFLTIIIQFVSLHI